MQIPYIGFTAKYADSSAWTESTGLFNCSTAINASYDDSSDDMSIDNGLCKVPLNWGTLLSYCLWFV